MDLNPIQGPFKNPNDIDKYWYQVQKKELEESIIQARKDASDPDNSKEETAIYKREIKADAKELSDLCDFVDMYVRCIERYKFNKNILEQIQEDWRDYNLSLYADYCRLQSMMLDPEMIKGEGLKFVQNESKLERIKREEIEKRIKDLLST